MLEEGREIALYFANSNLADESEYLLRLESINQLARLYDLALFVEPYNNLDFLDAVKGFEDEVEGGRRCFKCFEYNLGMTSKKCLELGFQTFCTSLTVSPRKNSALIGEAGKNYPNFEFYDFKPGGTYLRSVQIAKEHHFYRQRFCGCQFSKA